MGSIFSDQRRLVAVGAAIALAAAGVVLALIFAARPPAAGPAAPATTPGNASTLTPGASAGAAPSETRTSDPNGSTPAEPAPTPPIPAEPIPVPPVQPPAPLPPGPVVPGPASPAPAPPVPGAPFPAELAGRDLEVIPGAGRVVALTFDAGGNSAGLSGILQTLATTGVRGTFFLTGSWASSNPAGVATIMAGGHRLGNHSMTHPGFTGLPDAAIGDQLIRAQQAIQAAGSDPRPLFRFPFGERDARTIATVNRLGYLPVRWTVDTLGWKGTSGGITAQIVADRVLAQLQPGEIVLMHIGSNPSDGTTLDADALSQIISRIQQAGYGFTALDAVLD
ncbi:peptidoglycan/xylan/chitin deacetylase (PgdA/CDA1 family) [Arthrobacter sp. V4I6]|uniref:polysaccharide deacetylase family protein n=1 Tax=unclassified Arthrobacter TaxID=235627 RepID=UPI0027848D87|nr:MULTISPECIES: polysaccharide deacetylase family protein [unclassified Arthrobacter]MDQ0823028.1 peptidoglycan/xylan/chitin deacetylase (PgdA/CDA1 family) [Arthrobacter sp. V1I7]MDQ0852658.1 peptidoglycan/xylan/chitin deacetylase (PgdA/CDA1 family) [Arthrobacter sp. V4I6]